MDDLCPRKSRVPWALHGGCKRENALDLADATPAEQQELFLVLNELRGAIKKIFGADWLNYAFLGNWTRHLHGHVIPRYAKPKKCLGMVFEDKLYRHNYKTDHRFVTTEKVLSAVRNELQKALI
ncbi:HIT domain-containing protein [Candidatus Berkelbacteria bacterium]|nr:HIT domain-containing protein [Candidatus Berkelbacteria bacterium]